MPNRFYGSYRQSNGKLHGKTGPRGVRAQVQIFKHSEAVIRNRLTPHNRTKAHRLERCEHRAYDLASD